ncbi:MAG: preprotein translocase subunit SecY [Flavobacteriales bacterium]|nr:preprotein translocase subunit SecY [Flavobacteriales bacterium]
MKKLFQTIKNIWSIEDLRARIITTLSLLLVYRLGSFVVLPGVDSAALEAANATKGSGGLLELINIFAGGAFSRASIFALGIMPYISASIVIQLLGMAIPYFQRLQKEGESGRRKINQITRVLTIAITGFQAPGYIASQITNNPGVVLDSGPLWWFSTVLLLTTGTIFVMWIGERITEKGIGNGISLLIMIGIISKLPSSFVFEFSSRMSVSGVGGPIALLIEIAFLLLVTIVAILLVQGTRRIPVQYAKRIVGNKQYGGVRQYIPLKVNAAGVMPIIFAQAIMFVPMTLASFGESGASSWVITTFSNPYSFAYNLTFFLMIVAFTYFYTAVTVNPNQMADEMKRNGGFIPGIKPGKKTAEFIDNVMSRITLPGSMFLAVVAILPAFAFLAGVNQAFAYFYGGTSLLIMVGVILDTLQQIESHLLMRHYDGLMKSGRIKGRSSTGMGMAG